MTDKQDTIQTEVIGGEDSGQKPEGGVMPQETPQPKPVTTAPKPEVKPVAVAPKPETVAPKPEAKSEPTPQPAKPVAKIERKPGVDFLTQILQVAKDKKASDIHLSSGNRVYFRLMGDLLPMEEFGVLSAKDITDMLSKIMNKRLLASFEENFQADFAYMEEDKTRYRINAYRTLRGVSVAFRRIDSKIKTLEDLNAPEIAKKFAMLNRGLIIVSGPTGSGKSTTLAAIVDYINANRSDHIITIEDPVEFIHEPKKCLVNQREIGRDAKSFALSLKGALREDPDVILIGEMRDPETIKMALTAAETGHLVFGTLHTMSAAKTVDRIIDACETGEKEMIRSMLSNSLQAVILQTLLKKADKSGRVAAFEIMVATNAIKNLIREDKIHQVESMMDTGAKFGMVTMKEYIHNLQKEGTIVKEEADRILLTLEENK